MIFGQFDSSRDVSRYLRQYFVCGWGLSSRILYVFGSGLFFLWALSFKFLFVHHDLEEF